MNRQMRRQGGGGGAGGMGGMDALLKQAQQMQEQLLKAQEEFANQSIEATAGGGMVKVEMNGKHEVKRVHIDPSVAGDDRELLEDLVTAAVNDAVRKVEGATQQKFSGLMGGMQLPPGFKLPF